LPNLRIDQLPLDPRQLALGKAALVTRSEVDPVDVGYVQQRHGSIRQSSGVNALGIMAEGARAHFTGSTWLTNGDFTALFNLAWDDLAQAGSYPILTLRAGVTDDNWIQLNLTRSGADLTFRLDVKGATGVVTASSATLTANSSAGLAVVRSGNNVKLVQDGVEVIAPLNFAADAPTGSLYLDLLGSVAGLNGLLDKVLISGVPPVMSNLKYDATAQTVVLGDAEDRAIGTYDLHWLLDGDFPLGHIESEFGDFVLSGVPTAPEFYGSNTHFNGASGTALIKHTPDLDTYYSSILNPSSASTFGFHIEGTRALESVGRESTLIDYGGIDGLCLLEITAAGAIKFTMNEEYVTTAGGLFGTAAAETFKIFAGRLDGVLYLSVDVSGTLASVDSGAADNVIPFLDLNDIPDIYVGAASNSTDVSKYKGSLSLFAMYPSYLVADGGGNIAEFHIDMTTESLLDASTSNRNMELLLHHGTENIRPVYVAGGIVDAEYVGVAAGTVLAPGGPVGYVGKLAAQIKGDVSASQMGHLTFLTSEGKCHVANREKRTVRTLGIPQPSSYVSQQVLGGGTLKGAFSYGYRFVSDEGTTGPLLRLDPILVEGDSRVMLGAPRDPNFTPLGDTYLVTHEDTADVGRVDASAAIAANTDLPVELYARIGEDLADVEFKESVFHRGGRSTGLDLGLRSDSNAIQFDTLDNWTLQSSFRYAKSTITKYSALCGIGPNGSYWPNLGNEWYHRCPDFSAYLDHALYGNDTNGRLVVTVARRDHNRWDTEYEGFGNSRHYRWINNRETYKTLTFTNDDAGWWEEGAYYSLYFSKSSAKLRVYCSKRKDANAAAEWKVLTGRTGMRDGITEDNIFSRTYKPAVVRTATGFGIGHIPRLAGNAVNVPADGAAINNFPRTRVGHGPNPPASEFIREQGAASVQYAFRVWEYAKTENDLRDFGEDRFACDEDGRLKHKILIDFAPLVADDETSTGEIDSAEHASQERFYVQTGSSRTALKGEEMSAQYPGSLLAPREIPLMVMGDAGLTARESAVKVILTDIGDGGLVVEVGGDNEVTGGESEGRWSILEKVWNQSTLFSDVTIQRDTVPWVNPWDSFNWISFLLRIRSSSMGGNARAVVLGGLVLNGNQVFDSQVGGYDLKTGRITNWTTGYIRLGNDDTDGLDAEVHVGELRVWLPDQGPDPTEGSNYDYLLGRVSENEYANMRHYYKFQPADLDITVSPNLLGEYGVENENMEFEATAALNRTVDEVVGVPFPTSGDGTIAGIEIFRSTTISVLDFDDNSDVQKALDIARGVPQYFLAYLPIGTTDHIDSSPDSALGEVGDYTLGYLPKGLVTSLVWNNQLVLLDDNSRLWPAAAGPGGWESYAGSARIPNAQGTATAAVNVQGERNQAMVLVLGNSWATLLTGTPENMVAHALGGGIGATSQRCVTAHNGIGYSYNGTLWAVDQGKAIDFGASVQDSLPPIADARLSVSAKLNSLFVLNVVTGDALRYHFPTQQWSTEARDSSALGDLEGGDDAWVGLHGSWMQGDTSVYGDDVLAATPTVVTGTLAGTTVTVSTDYTATIEVGLRIAVRDSADVVVSGRVTAVTATTIVFDALALTAGAVSLFPGGGVGGLQLDTGYLDLLGDRISARLYVDILRGTNWRYAVSAVNHPGDRGLVNTVALTDLSQESGFRSSGTRGRFQRVILQNLERADNNIPLLEIKVT
jgi:hypothetical protein